MVVGREDISCKGGMLEPLDGLCLREKREMENCPGGVMSCMSGNLFRFCRILFYMRTDRSTSYGAVQAVFGPLS